MKSETVKTCTIVFLCVAVFFMALQTRRVIVVADDLLNTVEVLQDERGRHQSQMELAISIGETAANIATNLKRQLDECRGE